MKDLRTGLFALLLLCILSIVGYQFIQEKEADDTAEKAAILAILNTETKAFFNKDYALWQSTWVHSSHVAKTYIRMADGSSEETLGWAAIDTFGKTYIKDHPEPEPLPTLLDRIDVRLYGKGAWVSFEQNDLQRGPKRETRLMEKTNGQWKIAGMHTTIYAFEDGK
ncbi:MAG: hypothetical protein Roseis3KO_17910 [Roseivirga sp.]